MADREELEKQVSERALVNRTRQSIEQRLFEDNPEPQKPPEPAGKTGSRVKVFLFLLGLQIALLLVWAMLFFILGMLTQYEMIPFLPRLIEALQVLLSP